MALNNKKIVVFTGAGMSAESGIQTFRAADGLWANYRIEDVATFEAWQKDKALVLDFYNQRRKQILEAEPNEGHKLIASLQKQYDVQIITQNIDDLHERSGSKKVLHVHGEITKSRSTISSQLVYDIKGADLNVGDLCERNSQLRPHIVWFGEQVPEMDNAINLTEDADIFITIGTSLNVYPAANLMHVTSAYTPKFLIDPNDFNLSTIKNLTHLKAGASEGMKILNEKLKLL